MSNCLGWTFSICIFFIIISFLISLPVVMSQKGFVDPIIWNSIFKVCRWPLEIYILRIRINASISLWQTFVMLSKHLAQSWDGSNSCLAVAIVACRSPLTLAAACCSPLTALQPVAQAACLLFVLDGFLEYSPQCSPLTLELGVQCLHSGSAFLQRMVCVH